MINVVDERIPRPPDNLLHAHNGPSVKHFAITILLFNRYYFWMCNWCVCAASSAKSERGWPQTRTSKYRVAWTRMRPHGCEKKGGRDKIYFLETSLQSKEFKVCGHTPCSQASIVNTADDCDSSVFQLCCYQNSTADTVLSGQITMSVFIRSNSQYLFC